MGATSRVLAITVLGSAAVFAITPLIKSRPSAPSPPVTQGCGSIPPGNPVSLFSFSLNAERVSVKDDGSDICTAILSKNKGSSHPWVSDDGLRIVWSSQSEFVTEDNADCDTDRCQDQVYMRDLSGPQPSTYLISGKEPNDLGPGMKNIQSGARAEFPMISADGMWVVYTVGKDSDLFAVSDPPHSPLLSQQVVLYDVANRVNTIVSRNPTTNQVANKPCQTQPVISEDGRFIAFSSRADNLQDSGECLGTAPDDTIFDIFFLDRGDPIGTNATMRWLTPGRGIPGIGGGSCTQSDGNSLRPTMSLDGCLVAFESDATNLQTAYLPQNLGNPVKHVWVRDVQAESTTLLSKKTSYPFQPGDDNSQRADISADGEWVVYETRATNLLPPSGSAINDIIVTRVSDNSHDLVSLKDDGTPMVSRGLAYPRISGDGRFVIFTAPGGDAQSPWAFEQMIHDRDKDLNGAFDEDLPNNAGRQTVRLSDVPDASTQWIDGDQLSGGNACITTDGKWVAFMCEATNFVPNDQNGDAGPTSLCGHDCSGLPANPPCPTNWGRDIMLRQAYP